MVPGDRVRGAAELKPDAPAWGSQPLAGASGFLRPEVAAVHFFSVTR
jgi:hypothetical protein